MTPLGNALKLYIEVGHDKQNFKIIFSFILYVTLYLLPKCYIRNKKNGLICIFIGNNDNNNNKK